MLLQDFKSVFDHFGTLCVKALKLTSHGIALFKVSGSIKKLF